ncbi:MAG: hypothetical protein CSA20_07760 [Deltaproteobacteria bacterium]|nr:MAG: hypothetical protein CSA20_07760 [Deltaproteobacteria bacterium]
MDQFYQQPQQTYANTATQAVPVSTPATLGVNLQDNQFWKGALLGAAVTLLLTNESVQKGVVKTFSQLSAAAQSGIEEIKEKFEDAKAEAKAEAASE